MKFKNMKFNIGHHPDVNKSIQERLLELGYTWGAGCNSAKWTNTAHLFTNTNGEITFGLAWQQDHFEECSNQEIDIEWMKKPEERKTVEIGGKRYYEDDLAEALSKIKEADDID